MIARRPAFTTILLTAAAVFPSGPISAAEDEYFPPVRPAAGEELLPATTLAMATVPSATEFRRRWDNSSFAAMAEDPAFGPFFADVRGRADRASAVLGVDLTAVWADVDGEVTVALVPTRSSGMSAVSVMEFREEAGARRFLSSLSRRLSDAGASPLDVTAGGRAITSWSTADRGVKLAVSQQGTQVLVGEGVAVLAELASGEDRGEESLARTEAYQKVRVGMRPAAADGAPPPAVSWFLNPAAVAKAAVASNIAGNPNVDVLTAAVDASGLGSFRGFGGLFDLPGGSLDSVTSTYGYVKEPQGLVRAFVMPATRQSPPPWVNDEVSLYGQMNFRPEAFVSVVRELVDRMNGPGAFDRSVGSLPVGDRTVADVASLLSGPLHVAAEVPQSAEELTRQSTLLAVETSDPAVAETFVRALAEAGGAMESAAGGRAVFTLPMSLPLPPELAGAMRPEVALTVVDGTLLVATDGAYLARVLDGYADGTARPLSESAAYREIASQYPAETSAITFQRQDGRFAGLYEELRQGRLQAAGSVGLLAGVLGFDFTKLPPFPAMSRYLQTTGSFITPAADGFRIVSFSLPPREG